MNGFNRETTENALRFWRYGQTQAERLCAELLNVEGYQSIDPQCPLGGPDGLKDIICMKNGSRCIAAATFPTTEKSFREITRKFASDLEGVQEYNANGIVFFINQAITPTNREFLIQLANESGATAEIYHLERLRALLDAPQSYGLRLEYLRIPMTIEEQLSAYHAWKSGLESVLRSQEHSFRLLKQSIDEMAKTHSELLGSGQKRSESNSVTPEQLLLEEPIVNANLSLSILYMIHRAVCNELSTEQWVGKLRQIQVWIGPVPSTIEDAIYVPPSPDEVAGRISELLRSWNSNFAQLAQSTEQEKIEAIADFHGAFLSIHPFADANGQVAQVLLQQQIVELLGIDKSISLKNQAGYFTALQLVHSGNKNALRELVRSVVSAEQIVQKPATNSLSH